MHIVADIFYLFMYIYIYINTRAAGSCNAQLFMNQCNLPVFFRDSGKSSLVVWEYCGARSSADLYSLFG